jgi:HSP20 family molecular chaperone IbpA
MVIRIASSEQKPDFQNDGNPLPTPFRMFEDLFNNWALSSSLRRRSEAFRPSVDVFEKDCNLLIRCELPGIEEKEIDLRLDGRTVTIQGERKQEAEGSGVVFHRIESGYGPFSRTFDLPGSVDTEKITASFQNGVLTISAPQKPEAKPRVIKINE